MQIKRFYGDIYVLPVETELWKKKMTLHLLNLLYFFEELSHCGLKYQKKDGL